MLMFVSGATATMRKHRRAGELIVPLAGSSPESLRLVPGMWAMDNGAYSGFDEAAFVKMLRRFHGRQGCRFVAAPDVVADAHLTMALWPFWSQLIRGVGFVPALVAQDGLTVEDVPWRELGAVFIGGSTEWKLGPQAADICAYARTRGLWVHVGRVNTKTRIQRIAQMGANSFDGSSFSKWSETLIPKGLDWIDQTMNQGRLDV